MSTKEVFVDLFFGFDSFFLVLFFFFISIRFLFRNQKEEMTIYKLYSGRFYIQNPEEKKRYFCAFWRCELKFDERNWSYTKRNQRWMKCWKQRENERCPNYHKIFYWRPLDYDRDKIISWINEWSKEGTKKEKK